MIQKSTMFPRVPRDCVVFHIGFHVKNQVRKSCGTRGMRGKTGIGGFSFPRFPKTPKVCCCNIFFKPESEASPSPDLEHFGQFVQQSSVFEVFA